MKAKKVIYYLLLFTLTAGASLILGLLSFGGMFALSSVLFSAAFIITYKADILAASAAFILSVAYEGEIYLKNISGALQKLFQPDFLKYQLSNDYLQYSFPDVAQPDCPQFFRDYLSQLELNHVFEHQALNWKSFRRQRQISQRLKTMEKWFSDQAFSSKKSVIKPPELRDDTGTIIPLENIVHIDYANEYVSMPYVFIEETGELFHNDKEIVLSPTDQEKLRTYFYQSYATQVQQWLNGCQLTVMGTPPINTEDLPPNHYVFIQKTRELFWYDARGEATLIDISTQHLEPFVNNLKTLMGDKTSKHLTAEQLKTLTASPDGQGQLVSLLSDCQRLEQQLTQRYLTSRFLQILSILASVAMMIGTSYLLVSTLSILPFLAAIPALIIPSLIVSMSIIAGLAYGLLTYNAMTDLVYNNSVQAWFKKLHQDFQQGLSWQNVLMGIASILIFALTLGLTICTAGTWYTIFKETKPLFTWMKNIPSFITQILSSLILGLTTLAFNLENTTETLTELKAAIKSSGKNFTDFIKDIENTLEKAVQRLWERENIIQILNPFRLFLKLTVTPLRILFFLGHLISIGVTGDRLPGVPEIFSALLGIISEGFEDFHYFFDLGQQEHQCSDAKTLLSDRFSGHHNHNMDIPTLTLKFIFLPVYLLATLWDYQASQLNQSHQTRSPLTFKQTFEKQIGLKNVELPDDAPVPSQNWQKHHANYLLAKQAQQLESSLFDHACATRKATALVELEAEIATLNLTQPETLQKTVARAQENKIYAQHRLTPTLFSSFVGETDTEITLKKLPIYDNTKAKEKTPNIDMNIDSLNCQHASMNCQHASMFNNNKKRRTLRLALAQNCGEGGENASKLRVQI